MGSVNTETRKHRRGCEMLDAWTVPIEIKEDPNTVVFTSSYEVSGHVSLEEEWFRYLESGIFARGWDDLIEEVWKSVEHYGSGDRGWTL
jgi:hypothetical protein